MPLRDHFHTTSARFQWETLHGHWPSTMLIALNEVLPQEYIAQIKIHLGTSMELDVAALKADEPGGWESQSDNLAPWSPGHPAVLLETELPTPSEYELSILDRGDDYRLVAAVEIVSPSNKDRAESRRSFVNKCETLLRRGVCVSIVDVVTTRSGNLYGDLIDEVDAKHTAISAAPMYAVTCRGHRSGNRWRLESWEHELALGGKLPTLPIWLNPELSIPLDLEATYETACKNLRMG